MNMIVPKRSRLVLVGNGMAGVRAIEEILTRSPHAFQITVFGAEPHGNYNRIMLSPVLAGEKTFEAITTHPKAWYHKNDIELIAGDPVTAIDRDARTVTASSGITRPYDVLILATGSIPIIIPVPGHDLPGVIGFRDICDVETMLTISKSHRRAVVIGGGLLGLEAANGLLRNGMEVTVLHLMPTLMERQLDPVSAGLLKADLESRGMRILTEANTARIVGTDRVKGIRLKDGGSVAADLVVMAAGIRPNIALAKAAGLACNRGIAVDDGMRTSDPAIYAVGECAEHRGAVFGLVAPLYEMAKVLADRVTGAAETDYVPAATGTRLKVTGIDMFSAGDFIGDDTTDDIVFRDAARGVHKKLVLRGDRLIGCVLYGAAADSAWYFDMIRNGTDVSGIRDTMVFGPAVAPGEPAGVETLPETAEICGCNGVSKGVILAAIDRHKLTTLDQVRGRTKASSSCGGCTCQVEALIGLALGDSYKAAPAVKPVCKCTSVGHTELRKAIVARGLKTIPAVMLAMGWTTRDGCASCRPALNFYLLCAWPGEYAHDSPSRFVNERMHANIQKDGTKDLNAAGMVLGHAYGKALRTVKTCVGSEWCRFGTQDSTATGVALERMTWGSWTPHKTKMAVYGCPRVGRT